MARLYVNIPDSLLDEVEKLRKLELGELPRNEVLVSLIRIGLEVAKKNIQVVKNG